MAEISALLEKNSDGWKEDMEIYENHFVKAHRENLAGMGKALLDEVSACKTIDQLLDMVPRYADYRSETDRPLVIA